MKTYIFDLIPKIKRYSKKLDHLTKIQNQKWILVNDLQTQKTVYIFRNDKQLIISNDGSAEIGTWDYINSNTILVNNKEGSFLFNLGFFDNDALILNLDGTKEFVFFINETKYLNKLNTIGSIKKHLQLKYYSVVSIDYSNHPLGGSFHYINPLTLKREGTYTIPQLIQLKNSKKFTSLDKFVSVKDRKSHSLGDILNSLER